MRKSPWTRRDGRRRWPVGGQPAERPLEGGGGVAHLVEAIAPLGQLFGLGEADPVRVGPVDGGERLGALPQQAVAARVVEGAMDAPDDCLATDRVADQIWI